MKKISIVILAQHAHLVKQCLAAIIKHTPHPYELIVVNDGEQSSITGLPELKNAPNCRVIGLPGLSGVAAGYNRGAAAAAGERLVLIRDHMIVSAHWLEALSDCLDAHPDAGLVGPVSNDVSGWQRSMKPAAYMQTADRRARWQQAANRQPSLAVTRLLSILLMVDKNIFQKLGGFDERFGLETFEDDDLCYRALKAGYTLHVAQDCFASYMQPPSLFPTDPDWLTRQMEHNRRLAAEKWGEDLTAALYAWRRKVTVSLCMIVKNEEAVLSRCLSSVRDLVDEIIILDTGSTDRTKEIARQFGAKVYDFVWVNDFARARNRAFELATQEYILWLDADDILKSDDRQRFRELTQSLPWNTDAVSMPYHLAHDARGNVTVSLRRNRLVRRSRGFKWIGVVHEYLEVFGQIEHSDVCVTHDRQHTNSSRNLHIYEQRQASGETFTPRDLFYFSNELFDHGQWKRAAAHYEKFLELAEGWVEDKIAACGRAAECYSHLNDMHKARQKALQSFSYALPRAENCCRLGMFYLQEGSYVEAAWWYKLATTLVMPDTHAPLQHACWTWLPHLQLCVCYDRMGQHALASEHNELAAAYIPDDERILANRAYLSARLSAGSQR
ncbi:Glycosyltransferase, GT2 family [Paenibacillus sp. UNCCL117]|uniref:glycosyltransferase family 2 protein n=1 Tax=unclassified Paenibacillus TaxID=185978 RepID=UPI0008900028|nr:MULTISPECIES: glycosyltransferase [unclassified Paenibacillus]SDE46971.1 Glycosyltransferase, GT2 family [Paenibacillus sp. cl123]SFW65765.1 Glycosyltransferase, GT2 family [Paenibacillus sp. UNCCL117]